MDWQVKNYVSLESFVSHSIHIAVNAIIVLLINAEFNKNKTR